jgi:hypothetical protein
LNLLGLYLPQTNTRSCSYITGFCFAMWKTRRLIPIERQTALRSWLKWFACLAQWVIACCVQSNSHGRNYYQEIISREVLVERRNVSEPWSHAFSQLQPACKWPRHSMIVGILLALKACTRGSSRGRCFHFLKTTTCLAANRKSPQALLVR